MQTTNTHVQKGDDITNSSTLNHCTAAVVFCSIWQTIQFLSVVWADTYLYLDKYLGSYSTKTWQVSHTKFKKKFHWQPKTVWIEKITNRSCRSGHRAGQAGYLTFAKVFLCSRPTAKAKKIMIRHFCTIFGTLQILSVTIFGISVSSFFLVPLSRWVVEISLMPCFEFIK